MSEPQTPPPPPPAAQPPAKKKVSPWVWVLGGCLILILLVLLLMGACAFFVADKVKEGVEEFEANPGAAVKTAAEMAVRFNPDLELVSTDDEAGTMTILQKSTGEEITLNFEEIVEGRFSFETDEGESTITFDPEGEEGVTFETPEGTATFGAGAGDDLPYWVPLYPGASEPQGEYSSTSEDEVSGGFELRTTDPPARVLEYYERTLKADGMEVRKTTYTAQGSGGGLLQANLMEPDSAYPVRSVTVVVGVHENGETQISINYDG